MSQHECLYADDVPPTLHYKHMNLVAKVLPPLAVIDRLVSVANSFWKDHPDQCIAIHCA